MEPTTRQNNIEILIQNCQARIERVEGNDALHRKKIGGIWQNLRQLLDQSSTMGKVEYLKQIKFWFTELKYQLELLHPPKDYLSPFTTLEKACIFQARKLNNVEKDPSSPQTSGWNIDRWLERPLYARL